MPKRGDLLSLLNDRAGSIGRARYGKRASSYEPRLKVPCNESSVATIYSLQFGDEKFDELLEQKLQELISIIERKSHL